MKQNLRQEDNICIICKKDLGKFTAARASHLRTHVRDGSLKEIKEDDKIAWISTGNPPRVIENTPVTYRQFRSLSSLEFHPRIPVTAKSDKKGDVYIKCRKCGQFKSAMREVIVDGKKSKTVSLFADDRLISITCCESISPFPKRRVEALLISPGREFTE